MENGFKRLWSRRKSKDTRSNSVIDTRDSYPPNIPYSRSASVATHRKDAPPAASNNYPNGRGDGYNTNASRQEPPILAGSFLRPGTSSRPTTSNSIQQAVDRAANTIETSTVPQPTVSTRRTSFSSVKPPKSIDIFAVSQPQYALPRPSFNEDVAERNRDGVRQTFLHLSPPTSPLIPGARFSEDVAFRNAPLSRSTPSRTQVRSPALNHSEVVASRNAPPSLAPAQRRDLSTGVKDRKSPNVGSHQSIHNPPRGLALQSKSPPLDRRIPASSPALNSNRSGNAANLAQLDTKPPPSYPYGSPNSNPSSASPSITSKSEHQTFYNRYPSNPTSPAQVPLPERSLLRPVNRGEHVRVSGHTTPAASLKGEYGDFDLNIQSSPAGGGLPMYAHMPGRYQLSSSETAQAQAQGRGPIDRHRGFSPPTDRSLRPDFANMRTNSGVSNASHKKHINLPTRTIIDFTARETDSFTEGSDYGVDGTPIVEWAEADVMQLVHPAMVKTPVTTSPPVQGFKMMPSPITEEPPALDNASRSQLASRAANSTISLNANLQKPMPPLPSADPVSNITFSPISILASLPPGAIRKHDEKPLKSGLSTFIMNPAVTISPQKASVNKPRDSAISSMSVDDAHIVVAPPKIAPAAKEDNRIDLTLPPASPITQPGNRIDLTNVTERMVLEDGRIDLTDEPEVKVMTPPVSVSSIPDKTPVVPPQNPQQREVAHISDQVATVADVPAVAASSKAATPAPVTGVPATIVPAAVASSSKTRPVEQPPSRIISATPGVHTRDFADFEAVPTSATKAMSSAPAPVIRVPDRNPSRPKSVQRSSSGDISTRSQRMERGRSEDGAKRGLRRGKEDPKTIPRIAVYQSKFDDAEFARKREQANAALLRLQQSLDDVDYQGTRPKSLSPSRTASPIAPRPNGVGLAAPPVSASRTKPQRVETSPIAPSPVVAQISTPAPASVPPPAQSPRAASFHDIVTKTQPPPPTSTQATTTRSEVRGPTLPSNPSPWRNQDKPVVIKSQIPTGMTTDHFLDIALEPPRLLSDPNTRVPPSPGEVSLSSFPIPVSSPRTSKGSGEMTAGAPLVRTHSQKSAAPSIMSSTSMFSIPTHMIPDRSSSMRDQMVKEEEEGS